MPSPHSLDTLLEYYSQFSFFSFPPYVLQARAADKDNILYEGRGERIEKIIKEAYTLGVEAAEKILEEEIATAHTTTSGKTSRLTSAYNRLTSLKPKD